MFPRSKILRGRIFPTKTNTIRDAIPQHLAQQGPLVPSQIAVDLKESLPKILAALMELQKANRVVVVKESRTLERKKEAPFQTEEVWDIVK